MTKSPSHYLLQSFLILAALHLSSAVGGKFSIDERYPEGSDGETPSILLERGKHVNFSCSSVDDFNACQWKGPFSRFSSCQIFGDMKREDCSGIDGWSSKSNFQVTREEKNGVYICTISGFIGKDPLINDEGIWSCRMEMLESKITCTAQEGFPQPKIQWFLNNILIEFESREFRDRFQILTTEGPTERRDGWFQQQRIRYTADKKDNREILQCKVDQVDDQGSIVTTSNKDSKYRLYIKVNDNFDDVTDRCDKEACPPVNCTSPYIPLGECCPVCPPQEVVSEERRGSTSAQGRPGAPGEDVFLSVGDNLSLPCELNNTLWRHNNEEILYVTARGNILYSSNFNLDVAENGTHLVIKNIRPEDATSNGDPRCSFEVTVFYGDINWAGIYLVEPEGLEPDQTYRDVPVIEGDQEVFLCMARVVEGDSQNKITWDWNGHFNASTSGEMMTDTGVQYAVDTITVNIVDAAAIDENSIWCEYGNYPNTTIANTELLFKAFVPGGFDFPPDLCESCNGTEYFKLSKATKKNTPGGSLSLNMKQMIREKVINKYGATGVVTDSSGNICGCT